MVARMRTLQARVLPHGWRDAARQVLLFALAYLAYRLVRGFAEGDSSSAFAHARDLISIERTLHVFVEPSVQAWASGSRFLMVTASWLYVNAQTTITFTALLYMYLRHNRNFYFVRNMFMIAMALALVGYAVFPTAPPRFLPEWGFFDTVAAFGGVHISHHSMLAQLANPYAAVPSMHVAFALMIGWPLARLSKHAIVRVVWLVYPFLMAFVIVVTANHFIIDALLGALTAGVAAYGAGWLARRRPEAGWDFSAVHPASAALPSGAAQSTSTGLAAAAVPPNPSLTASG